MNTTYSLASSRFTDGEVRCSYNEQKLLTKFEVIGEIDFTRLVNVLKNLPLTTDELEELKGKSKTLTITEVLEEVTFDMFWRKYNDPNRSSKKKSLARWNKLNVPNQRKAFFYYDTYIKNIPPGIDKKYCETYLNAELWNN